MIPEFPCRCEYCMEKIDGVYDFVECKDDIYESFILCSQCCQEILNNQKQTINFKDYDVFQ